VVAVPAGAAAWTDAANLLSGDHPKGFPTVEDPQDGEEAA
jgi:hypothetical protein